MTILKFCIRWQCLSAFYGCKRRLVSIRPFIIIITRTFTDTSNCYIGRWIEFMRPYRLSRRSTFHFRSCFTYTFVSCWLPNGNHVRSKHWNSHWHRMDFCRPTICRQRRRRPILKQTEMDNRIYILVRWSMLKPAIVDTLMVPIASMPFRWVPKVIIQVWKTNDMLNEVYGDERVNWSPIRKQFAP